MGILTLISATNQNDDDSYGESTLNRNGMYYFMLATHWPGSN